MKYTDTTKGGNVIDKRKNTVHAYQPSEEVQEIIASVRDHYLQGYNNWHKTLVEFNNRSVIDEINANQKTFNSYIPPKSDDPDESWRAQTVRPIVRNKLISIAAHVTANIIYPSFFAQNKDQEEDRMAGQVIEDIVKWIVNNSNYSRAFMNSVISALVDPATVLKQEYKEVMRTVKKKQEDGTYKEEEVIDEIMSGFCSTVIPLKEFYIANLYEPELQKQKFVIHQRYMDYDQAEQIYGSHENFKYVDVGHHATFSSDDSTFYDTYDENIAGKCLVHVVDYYNRAKDLHLVLINGVLVTDKENPNERVDKRYPYSMTGYEPINNGKFALFKSAANKMGPDEDMVNTLYNMVLDGSFMALMPPVAIYGKESINSSVLVPGSITSLREESKLDTIGPKSDLRAGLLAIEEVEKSISESSQDNMRSGLAGGGERTAYEIQKLEENAQKMLGLFASYIGFMVTDVGYLMLGDIIQHLTVADLDKVTDIKNPLKYKTLLLPNEVSDGKKVTKEIRFKEDTGEKPYKKSLRIFEEEGGMKQEKRIYEINPQLIREYKYMVLVTPDKFEKQSKALERALGLELYDRAISNPLVDQRMVTQDFLFESYKPGQSSKYMAKEQAAPEGQSTPFEPAQGVDTNMAQQVTGSNSLKALVGK